MRISVITIAAALLSLAGLHHSALAQQKTVKACQAEWRANKADNQAKGITEKAYVAECRADGPAAQPAPAPSPTVASPSSSSQSPAAAAPNARKTVKACQDEWRANRADNQAKGITKKAYVQQCRGSGTAAQPTHSSAAQPSSTSQAPSSTAAPSPQKTVRACQDEWRANKEAYQAAKITERAYVEKCRAGEAVALPSTPAGAPSTGPTAAAPAPSQSAPAQAPSSQIAPTPAPAPTQARPAAPAPATPGQATAPTGADQFQTEAQAKSHCPADLVVWVNLTSKIYHFAGHRSYGTTKQGAYMCEQEATAQGFRASKTEKRPST
jgi:hypothetical protein